MCFFAPALVVRNSIPMSINHGAELQPVICTVPTSVTSDASSSSIGTNASGTPPTRHHLIPIAVAISQWRHSAPSNTASTVVVKSVSWSGGRIVKNKIFW